MGQPTSERAVSFSTEELRVWEVFICLLDELKGEAFTFLAWRASDCQRAPALTEGQPNARSDLFPSYFFFWGVNKWRNYETMRFWPTLAVFFWSPLCNRTGTKKSCLLVWMVNENQFPISILHLAAAAKVMTSPTTTPSLSLSLSIGHVQF
jgi:hypothetical protein